RRDLARHLPPVGPRDAREARQGPFPPRPRRRRGRLPGGVPPARRGADRRMKLRVLIRLKPGILDVQGAAVQRALAGLGFADLHCVVLSGGFSYGDYLRAGAVAGKSPVVEALREFVANGGYVLGSCNGFQILCEAGLLPGVLMRNECLQYRCQSTNLLVENVETPFTRGLRAGQVLTMPISPGEGTYYG